MALRTFCMKSACDRRLPVRPMRAMLLAAGLLASGMVHNAHAVCAGGEPAGARGVAAIDARTFRLQDGSEVRLAGVESAGLRDDAHTAAARDILDALVRGKELAVYPAAKRDRYGRQVAFVFPVGGDVPLQARLLAQGVLAATGSAVPRDCVNYLMQQEIQARLARRGIWADSDAIKSAEMPGDILAQMGRFVVVQGRVHSVRESGATIYVNFGRRWTRDFALIVPKRLAAGFAAAGLELKSIENRIVRVRGFVEQRGGPRIEAFEPGQIEVVGGN